MEYAEIQTLHRHPAWRLLRATHAPLILTFLGSFFVDGNRGACPSSEVTTALDDTLYELNSDDDTTDQPSRYPKDAREYLDDWSADDTGFLRRFYPTGDAEIYYEVTPGFEKAYSWVASLQGREFVGTESRLHIAVELLRQIVHGTEADPQARLDELHRQRAEIDAQIADVEAGRIAILGETAVRDRYQQFSSTARELLADFREVEENFRALDRAAREKIAAWRGAKGELLGELIGSRSHITGSDQGRSFQAFYDYLLSQSRQDELSDLLGAVNQHDELQIDPRLKGIHYQWAKAAERAQHTVRQISEQLRRFLDDQVWLENRRVLDLVRSIETLSLETRDRQPTFGLEIDETGIGMSLPFARPLYERPTTVTVNSRVSNATDNADPDLLFQQRFIDSARLAGHIRALVPKRTAAALSDIVDMFPLEQGAAEIIGYLSLSDEDISIEMDDATKLRLRYTDREGAELRAVLPNVTVRRL